MRGVFPSVFKALTATCMLMATTGCASGVDNLAPLPMQAASAEYRIDTADKLRIVVQEMKDLSSDYVVDEAGYVAFPLIKRVMLRDKTLREAEGEIERVLTSQNILVDPKVSIQPLELRPLAILGEVNRPGEYAFRQGMTVFAAVSAAGGYTYRANTQKVMITRTVNGKSVSGTATDDTVILPGDRIKVLERWF